MKFIEKEVYPNTQSGIEKEVYPNTQSGVVKGTIEDVLRKYDLVNVDPNYAIGYLTSVVNSLQRDIDALRDKCSASEKYTRVLEDLLDEEIPDWEDLL